MIELFQDGELIAKVRLEGDSIKVEKTADDDAKALIEHFREWPGRKLSDRELYELLPSRLTGRTSAQPVDEDAARFQQAFTKLNAERLDRREAKRAGA